MKYGIFIVLLLGNNDFSHLQQTFAVGEKEFVYFDIPSIEPGKYGLCFI